MAPAAECVLTPSAALFCPKRMVQSTPDKKKMSYTNMAAPKKGSRVKGAAREKMTADLKEAYDSGASIRKLAERNKRSYGFVHRMLGEAGVTFRDRGGSRGRPMISRKGNAAE
jgi:hypothetical protein